MDDETRTTLTALHPLGRAGTPRDIAAITSFLLSDEGRWISGQLLHADGGFSARYREGHQRPVPVVECGREATDPAGSR